MNHIVDFHWNYEVGVADWLKRRQAVIVSPKQKLVINFRTV